MVGTMRTPLVVDGAGDHCLPKLHHQPYILACCMATQIALCAAAPFEVFNTKAPVDLPSVPEIARVHGQCLRRQCGLVRIGSVVYVCLCGAAVGPSGWGILEHL